MCVCEFCVIGGISGSEWEVSEKELVGGSQWEEVSESESVRGSQ